jgi:hypothetical protein
MAGILQLTDQKVGTLRDRINEKNIFLDKFTDKTHDWKKKETSQGIFYRTDNFPKTDVVFHRNYITYLARCWGDHLGAIFSPDILWNSLLCELASIVKEEPETYRHLFTDSADKKDIIVLSGDPVLLPLNAIIEALKDLVPTDSASFLPEFSTSTLRSKHAFNANFADMCSPYYSYSMLLCNIPLVDVRGEKADYNTIVERWDQLKQLFSPQKAYMEQVHKIIKQILENLNNPSFWQTMFSLERCGSGSEVVVSGWWTKVYRELPRLAYPDNFSSHVAKVSYTNLTDSKKYIMYDGLFFSKITGDFLEPNFGFAVYEDREKQVIPD